MNRVEIKKEAKAKVKGNIWNLLWPLLVISVIYSIISNLLGRPNVDFDIDNIENIMNIRFTPTQSAGVAVASFIAVFLTSGYYKYVLNFIRTGQFDSSLIVKTIKERWLDILIAEILVYVLVGLGFVCLVIPGIILSFSYTFVRAIVVDSDIQGSDALKKSREMMKGYKFDYFIFILSFIGWFILVPFTFGLLLIWLVPYLNVSQALYYEKLKNLK